MRFIYLIFFILTVNLTHGDVIKKTAPASAKPAILQIDTSVVTVRHFNNAALNNYKKQPEFQYKETKEILSWWDRFWLWFWNWIGHFFNFNTQKGMSILGVMWTIVEILLILGGVAALIFFILKSAGIDIRSAFSRKSTPAPIPYSELFEDINAIDFDAEIENAVAKYNYRFAVRMLYLKCLKQLNDAGQINWQIDKTNSNYIDELNDNEQRQAFSLLTRQFEYVWYGEFLIDAQVYNNIDLYFKGFKTRPA